MALCTAGGGGEGEGEERARLRWKSEVGFRQLEHRLDCGLLIHCVMGHVGHRWVSKYHGKGLFRDICG